MFWPASKTLPCTHAPGTTSCMRLRQRTSVLLPQPEGPMIAVTWQSGMSSVTPRIACVFPYQAESSSTLMPASNSFSPRGGGRGCGCFSAISSSARIMSFLTLARSGCEPHGDIDDENEQQKHQRGRPGLAVQLLVGPDRVLKNREGHRRH